MKNKIKLVLLTLFLMPTFVSAISFKDGNSTYILEERKISCLSEEAYIVVAVEDNLYFAVDKDDEISLVEVNSKNECKEVEADYVYSLIVDRDEVEYYLEKIENKYVIKEKIEYFDKSGFRKTKDTEIVEGKKYYIKTQHGSTSLISEADLKVEDIGSYYEEFFVESAKETKFDLNKTYYYVNSEYDLEIVENPTNDKLSSYYIESELPFEIKTIQTITSKETQELIENTKFNPDIAKIGESLYILIGKEKIIDDFSGLILFDLYDLNGNKIENIHDINYLKQLNDNLVLVSKEENFEIFNVKFEKLYENSIDNIKSIEQIAYKDYVNYFMSMDEENDKELYYNLYEYKVLDTKEEIYSDKDASFRFSGKLERLSKVYLNDIELNKDNYLLERGSTIVTLKSDYLKTLEDGKYTLKVAYQDGVELETTFNLKVVSNILPSIPETLDNIFTYITISILCIGIIAISLKYIKKRTN